MKTKYFVFFPINGFKIEKRFSHYENIYTTIITKKNMNDISLYNHKDRESVLFII